MTKYNIFDLPKRAWEKIEVRHAAQSDEVDTPCWDWIGGKYQNGYGMFGLKSHPEYAHRYTYKFFVGEIPKDKECDHLCCNKACCNPEHIELVSSCENSRRIVKRGRHTNANKTHCKHGHPLSGENLYTASDGKRECRECKRESNRQQKQRRKAGAPIAQGNKDKTHCKRGHPLSGENLYTRPNGERECRECKRERDRRWHQMRRKKGDG